MMTTTSSRRDFLNIASAGSVLAASGVFWAGALAAPADMPQGGGRHLSAGQIRSWRRALRQRIRSGRAMRMRYKALEAAWNAGVRYYDVSPWYGTWLGERGPVRIKSSLTSRMVSVVIETPRWARQNAHRNDPSLNPS